MTELQRRKWFCLECGWCDREHLVALNPFDPSSDVVGCPQCFEVNSLVGACDIDGCCEPSTCGAPSLNPETAYLMTCSKHFQGKETER